MPCIIKEKVGQYNKYYTYCGKVVLGYTNQHKTRSDAEGSDKAICVKCRKSAGMPPKERVKKTVFEPFYAYEVTAGTLEKIKIVSETPLQLKTDTGRFVQLGISSFSSASLFRTGANRKLITTDFDEAKAFCEENNDRLQQFHENVLREILSNRRDLKSFKE